MTAEVDVHRDACESDVSKFEDNVNVSVNGNGNGISKDEGDGSYIFVTGIDAGTSDESDLTNGHCGGVGTNGGGGGLQLVSKGESVDVVEDSQSQLQSQSHSLEKAAAVAEESRHSGDPEIALEPQSEEDQKLEKEVPLENLVQESDVTSQSDSKLDKQVIIDSELKGDGDCVLACDNGSCEKGRSEAADSVEADEVHLERQLVNDTVSDENGDVGLPTHDLQQSLSESSSTNQLVDKDGKTNGSCGENGQDIDAQESISEPIAEVSKILVATEESISEPVVQEGVLEPISGSINGSSEGDGQIANLDVQESVSDPITEKVNGLCEENGHFMTANLDIQASAADHTAEKNTDVCEDNCQISEHDLEVQNHLETQKDNGIVGNESGDELFTIRSHEKSISEPLDANPLAPKPEETGSCENGELLAAVVEVQNQLGTPVISGLVSDESGELPIVRENISEPKVTGSLVSISEETGSSEKASVCENVPVENGESLPTVENGDSVPKDDNSTHSIDDGTEEANVEKIEEKNTEEANVEKVDKKNSEKPSSCPSEHSEPEVEVKTAPIKVETCSSFTANDAISESHSKSEGEIASVADGAVLVGIGNGSVPEPSSKSELESEIVSGPPASDVMLEPNLKSEVESGLAPAVDDKLSEAVSESRVPLVVDDILSGISADDAIQEPRHDSICGVKPVSDDAVHVVDAELSNLKAESTDNDLMKTEATVAASSGPDDLSIVTDDKPESGMPTVDSCEGQEKVDSFEGQEKVVEVEKRPFYYLIRCPRNDDENLKEQIKHAQLQVEEKTKDRDAIRSKLQMQRATCKDHKLKFEAAISEERAAQELLKSKRQEMDSVQFMNNKVKDALSVEEIANTIRHMEHTMSHETLPLKEEKQYIRDIKQLKQRRDQLSSSLGKQDEVQRSLDQKGHIEKRIQDLKKEMDQLRNNLLKAQEVTQAAKKDYNIEKDFLHELQYQFEAADATRQQAYLHLQSLRKQNYEKTKHFWRYRNDAKAANDLALSGDKEQLQHLCIDQVESFMELWNTNEDFRKEYIKCNTRSTLRRLRTYDGRSLGPDEEPGINIVRVTRHYMAAAVVSTPEPVKRVAIVESEEPIDKSAVEIVEQNIETAKNKKPVKVASAGISQATVSGRNEIEEEIVEDPKPTKEEELARKEEELRKEETAAKLREQRRLEEKAKAKEAMERKKKIAEKAQARAAIKAQKEAEEKEKEREKRVRKKERKKASATKSTNGTNEGESAPEPGSEIITETPLRPEATEKPVTITKRSQKVPQFTKQTKVKPIPPPLRNRSKRRMQPWMWVLVTVVAILGLFLLGNGGSFSFQSMLERFF